MSPGCPVWKRGRSSSRRNSYLDCMGMVAHYGPRYPGKRVAWVFIALRLAMLICLNMYHFIKARALDDDSHKSNFKLFPLIMLEMQGMQ